MNDVALGASVNYCNYYVVGGERPADRMSAILIKLYSPCL